MHTLLLILHSWLRWAVVITAIWTIARSMKGTFSNTPYTAGDNRSNLFFMISCDLQMLIGLGLYFFGPMGLKAIQSAGMSAVMQQSSTRFFTIEHETMMILALIIVHIGRSVVKKAPSDIKKHKKSLAYFGIAFILILLAIPWPFRTALGFHPWFRF
ncbi:hypothetical protein [Compostibacter hankyongensis]|uniref:Cytochrome B n=1 Tax=Compostibacter hankyongensis TaxID=1007089 RepID=A0ABP8FTL8_9BACT